MPETTRDRCITPSFSPSTYYRRKLMDGEASIFWPLLCTTNYDDIYLRAKLFFLRSLGSERKITIPRLFGRSETDCRRILQQLNFPDGEVIWAVQGLVAPMDASLAALVGDEFNQ